MNELEIAAGLCPTPSYRYAELINDQLLVAGQVPHDKHGALVGANEPATQARQCLDNLRILVEAHAFKLTDIRQLKIYVVGDREALSATWDAITAWFNHDVPPATLLGVARLGHHHQVVEIDATIIHVR